MSYNSKAMIQKSKNNARDHNPWSHPPAAHCSTILNITYWITNNSKIRAESEKNNFKYFQDSDWIKNTTSWSSGPREALILLQLCQEMCPRDRTQRPKRKRKNHKNGSSAASTCTRSCSSHLDATNFSRSFMDPRDDKIQGIIPYVAKVGYSELVGSSWHAENRNRV